MGSSILFDQSHYLLCLVPTVLITINILSLVSNAHKVMDYATFVAYLCCTVCANKVCNNCNNVYIAVK